MFERLGVLVYRLRYLVVLAWVVVAVLSVLFAPSLASSGAADQATFLPAYAPSVRAEGALERGFPGAAASSSATLAFSRTGGLTDADHAYVEEVAAWARSGDRPAELVDAVKSVDSAASRPELESMLRSGDGVLELLVVNLTIGSAGDEAEVVVSQLRDHLAATAPNGLAAHVTGSAGITTDYIGAIEKGTDSTTIVTIVLVVLILLLIYRAPLAALVPLVTIGAAFLVGRGALGMLAAAGWEVSSLLDTFIVVLVFGVGTDYAIFLISRYREEVRHEDWHEAVRDTVGRIGGVISASAATVIVGLAAMAFADFGMIRTTGPALGVAVFITLLAGLTLTPALLGIFGHYLFWPLHMKAAADSEPDGFFARLAAAVSRHPGIVTVALSIALFIPILYVPQAKTNFDTLAELPPTSDARAGYDVVAEHLGKGRITQSTAIVNGGGGVDILSPAMLARMRDTVLAVDATEGVDTVTSLVTPDGDGTVPEAMRPSVQLGTIADELSADTTGSTADSSALLDAKVTDGLDQALDYVSALGAAFPDVAARSEYRATTSAIADARDVVDRAREQSLVASQLRTLASAMTSTSALASSGGDADTSLLADYLDELAAAYPEVRGLPAWGDVTAAAASLAKEPGLDAAVAASNGLQALAGHFDARPDATLFPDSLAGTEAAKEARREAEATFDALPVAFRALSGVFDGRTDDIFVPVGIGGDRAADIEQAVDAFVSADRTTTRFYVTTTDDPYSIAAFRTVRTVRDDLVAASASFGPAASADLYGSTAQLADVQDVLASDFLRVGIVTVLGVLLVLILLLRALVAPLYLVATVLLSYGSALGISAFLFQEVLGHPGISFYLPLMVFVLLVALGADYNIFLMSRVREESETRPIREGIRVASGRTGAVITSAGLILAGTFGSMATAPLVVLFQVGVAVAIGVLIDTFLVRSILVPAITTIVGDRAWWPSGMRLGERALGPVPAAAADGVLATATAAGRRSRRRLAVALVLAALVPVTFAGLVVWSQTQGGTSTTPAAVVVLDEGATISRADGTTAALTLGTDLADQLVAGDVTDAFRWEAVDAATAADGLGAGTYGAVLTVPADFSRRVAAIRADATGAQPAAALDLALAPGQGAGATEVAREVRAAIASTAARDASASYVEDVLLAVTTADRALTGGSADARALADRTATLADDASGIRTVSGELVMGLDELASGATTAVDGVTELVDGTSALASGTALVADGATAVAAGAEDASAGATELSSGAASLSDGLRTLDASTSGLPAQTAQLASGADDLAAGASQAAAGADDLAAGLGTLATETSGLPGQTQQLADGAAQLSTGTTQAAAGATELAAGLGTMRTETSGLGTQTAALATGAAQLSTGTTQAAAGATDLATGLAAMQAQTTGLGAQAQALASGAAALAAGAAGVSDGATQTAAGAAALATGADTYAASVTGYTSAVSVLSASCLAQGGGPLVCAQLAAIAAQGPMVTAGASDLATGAHGVAGGAAQVATGAAGVSAGAADLATGSAAFAAGAPALETGIAQAAGGSKALADALTALTAGAAQLADGTARLAAGMPQLEAGIAKAADGSKALADALVALASGAEQLAQGAAKLAAGMPQLVSGIAASSDGAAQLATGTTGVADGAAQLATGTQQLADGMAPLASGITTAASGAADLAGGAAQLAGGVSDLAAGSSRVASGAEETASGAATLADGTATAVSGFGRLTDAMDQLVDGARVVESRSGLLADDGTAVSADAGRVADGLGGATIPGAPETDAARAAVAERAADPVVVRDAGAGTAGGGGTAAGIAPYVMSLALWLGALVAFLVLPSGRRGRGRRWWAGPVGAFAAAALLGAVGAALMVAGLRLGVGIDVARLPALVAVAALAAAAFAAIIQALVVAVGDRGWLLGLLFAGVQAAACASPYIVDALPGPLAALRPLMPVTWAADAFRACIDGTTAGLATGVLALAGSLALALLVTLAVSWGTDRPPATAPAPA
jgi:RND superfamily putative drug exporter